jgi:hypothetical protein
MMIVSKRRLRATPFRAGSVLAGLAIVSAAVWAPLTSAATHQSARAASSAGATTYYAKLSKKQYINNGGDRARGEGNNPFGNYVGVSLNIPVNADERTGGPYPGDFGEYQFTLYSNAAHTKSAGDAIFICQYGFSQSSICDIVLHLGASTITGKGVVNFEAKQFSLAVTGGTGAFRAAKGGITATAGGQATQAQPVKRSVPLLQSLTLGVTSHPVVAASAPGWQRVVITESPAGETFVNNNDDESRGDVNNPWGGINNTAASIIDEHVNGPFPGDEAFYSLKIKTKSNGTGLGLFMCQYYFNKNGLCHATFKFGGGTLVAEGAFNFNAKTFTLAVTGGYGSYGDEVGEIDAAAASGNAQELTFEIHKVS